MQVFTADETIHLAGWEFDLISAEQPVDPPTRSREKRGEIFQFEVEQFLRAASGSTVREPLCDFDDAFRTQRVVDAVKQSLATNLAVEILPRP